MRLEPFEVEAIRRAARHAFGDNAVVRLFGSRTDDARMGGDIDLHVEVADDIDEAIARQRFESNLFARIDAQRVDVVVHRRGTPLAGIDHIAQRDGLVL